MTGQLHDGGRDEAELEERRAFLLRSLFDLDVELAAGDLDAHDYAALKDRYTARAAAVLRRLDELHGEPAERVSLVDEAASPVGGHSGAGRRRRWVGPAVATAVAGFAVLAALLVTNSLGQRLPGTPPTGAIQQTGPAAALAQASQDLSTGKYSDALRLYDGVIKQNPRQPEALAYKGWILFLTGQQANLPALIDRGLGSVRAAEAADPAYFAAHFFAGMILMQRRDPAGAAVEFKTSLADNPPAAMVPEIRGVLQNAQTAASSARSPTSTTP